ncbi:hypothetical protein OCU04_000380 [Sclerotinia nivalis]|uniref:Uncharacterized protein n=1 Tax=Sclerotinia nivalis TaxID=352851 RepID=A0A9X0DNC9_9HELO|nr:hypothetical protein OCU04_000380 [Sclerotinia nivalis]
MYRIYLSHLLDLFPPSLASFLITANLQGSSDPRISHLQYHLPSIQTTNPPAKPSTFHTDNESSISYYQHLSTMRCVFCNNQNMTFDQQCSECSCLLAVNQKTIHPYTIECHNTNGNTTATVEVNEKIELANPNPDVTQSESTAVEIKAHGFHIVVYISEDLTQDIKVSVTRGIVYPNAKDSVSSASLAQ